MTDPRAGLLDEVFGPGDADTPQARAAESSRLFVRGLDLLTIDRSAKATGRRLTAIEALDAYGFDKLCEIVEDGSAIISASPEAAGRALKERRGQLDLPIKTVASRTGLTPNVVEALEESSRRPIREYERVARVLGLDERAISFRPMPEGNERVAVRLRSLADDRPSLSPSTVANLAEAAWVAMTQIRLEEHLGLGSPEISFKPSSDYGYRGRPAYRAGYELADEVREALSLGDAPIPSMRELAEETLRIPVIQARLNDSIAGATIESASRRAIVLNLEGMNADAMVRRSTVAHELCHLLFDPSQQLDDLRVDEYSELDQRADERTDPVEQRANAFAVQLLAPRDAAVDRYRSAGGDLFTAVLDHFGLSFTAGRYQVWNGLDRSVPLDEIQAPNRRPELDWDARESYTVSYHPIRELANRPSRAGRFSAVAVRCAQLGIVSWDTASEWLYCSQEEAAAAAMFLADLYPTVFEAS
jgi:Zn-dependent peptidase ImmA (M78 family)